MLTHNQRLALFSLVCIPMRLALALLAKQGSPEVLRCLGYLALCSGLGFVYRFYAGGYDVGAFGGRAWWAKFRLVHGFLHLAFGLSALNGSDRAWVFAMADVVFAVLVRMR